MPITKQRTDGSREIDGGKLKDIPRPHRRKFRRNDPRREVVITLTTFRGMSIGAKHYYLRLHEEHNPIWDVNKQAWHCAWDDEVGRGKDIEIHLTQIRTVERETKRLLAEHFPYHKVRRETWMDDY